MKATELANKIWPLLRPRVETVISNGVAGRGGGSGGSLTAHSLDGAFHTGTLSWSKVNKTGSSLADLETRNHSALTGIGENDHHSKVHALATTSGLSTDHTVSGLTAGQVLRASGATAAAFAVLQHGDLGGVSANQHHNQVHVITGSDHTITAAQYNVVGATATNTLGILATTPDGNANVNTILRSSGTGTLTLSELIAVTKVRTPLIDTAAGDLLINPAGAVQFQNTQTLRTSTFDSSFPVQGWQVNEVPGISGYSALTIGKIAADELAVKVFVADETRVDRGNQYWTKSYGIVAENFDTPSAIGGTVNVTFEDSPAMAGAIFSNNDWLLFRIIDLETGLTVSSIWGQVNGLAGIGLGMENSGSLLMENGDRLLTENTTALDNGDGTQSWAFTLRSGPTNTEVKAGNTAVDFGQSGAALVHLSVLDPAGAPYIKLRRWAGADPFTSANLTTYVQLGHLGSIGNSLYTPTGDGLYIRSTADEGQFIVADDIGLQIRGADFEMWNGASQTVDISSVDGSMKLGTNISADATTSFDFDGTTGDTILRGIVSAADDVVRLDATGARVILADNVDWASQNSYRFDDTGGTERGGVYGWYVPVSGIADIASVGLRSIGDSTARPVVYVRAENNSDWSEIDIRALRTRSGGTDGQALIQMDSGGGNASAGQANTGTILVSAGSTTFIGNIVANNLVQPGGDLGTNLGSASLRWGTVHASSIAATSVSLTNPAVTSGTGVLFKHSTTPFTVTVPSGQELSLINLDFRNTQATFGASQFYGLRIITEADAIDTGAAINVGNFGRADGIYISAAGKSGAVANNEPTGLGIDVNRDGSGERSSTQAGFGIQVFDWSSTNVGVDGPKGFRYLKQNNNNTDHIAIDLVTNRRAIRIVEPRGAGYTADAEIIGVYEGVGGTQVWNMQAQGSQFFAAADQGIFWQYGSQTALGGIRQNGNYLDVRYGPDGFRLVKHDYSASLLEFTDAGNLDMKTGDIYFLDTSRNQALFFDYGSGQIAAIIQDISGGFLDIRTGPTALRILNNAGSAVRAQFYNDGKVNFANLPTSSTGLSAGDLWNDGGTVKIV